MLQILHSKLTSNGSCTRSSPPPRNYETIQNRVKLIRSNLLFSEGNALPKLFSPRKDFFYSYDRYPEADLPDPVDGGRFHLVTTSSAGKAGVIEASFAIQRYLLLRPSHAYLSASSILSTYC